VRILDLAARTESGGSMMSIARRRPKGDLELIDTLSDCHDRLRKLIDTGAEPTEVLRRAEEHRRFWRPERVRVVLLAESHVYTTRDELAHQISLPAFASAPAGLPLGFVRLVYCLGYGENDLLQDPVINPRNTGTPQYWQVFRSCANSVSGKQDFAPIQKSTTTLSARTANKLALLRTLRELGVWLLDASPAALYYPGQQKPDRATLESCVRIGWDYHVRHQVEIAGPSHIVVIGRGVERTLRGRLLGLQARVTVLPQPNAHLTSDERRQCFNTYRRVVGEANLQP
jgi:hypothetical protein